MSEHPIQGLMKTAMENIKEMVDVNTIIGDPVETKDGSVIIPVSKVGFGFAAGGSEFKTNLVNYQNQESQSSSPAYPFGGGSGGGVSITPVAFIVVGEKGIRLMSMETPSHLYDRLIDFAPQFIEKIQGLGKRKKTERTTTLSEET